MIDHAASIRIMVERLQAQLMGVRDNGIFTLAKPEHDVIGTALDSLDGVRCVLMAHELKEGKVI